MTGANTDSLPARAKARWGLAAIYTLILVTLARPAHGYSVLTHEAIIDSLWIDTMRPLLTARFPEAAADQLNQAHGYAYGGCIIQDLGYYPFGSHFFSDLAHYVRSANFVEALVEESRDLNEYAFALGAVAHYGADIDGHSIAVNRAVPLLYPKLREKFGNEVTYADDPPAHLKTEFGFDVLQVARGHYAPEAYHDFIGFQVSKDLLDRAFQKTYGLTLKDVFHTLDLSLGTYRFSVNSLIPTATQAAWDLKRKEILQQQPTLSRREFRYNINRSSFEREWGSMYQRPSLGARVMAFFFRLLPKAGPFRGLAFKVPTPQIESMFEDSFDAAVRRDRQSFDEISKQSFRIANRDLDTGRPVSPGEYALTDTTYDALLRKIADKKFDGVSPELRTDILGFYARMKTPDAHGITPQLDALKALQ